ncbi:MAG: hypothetical protein AABZ08_09920 [Planctomycetota bacterium]
MTRRTMLFHAAFIIGIALAATPAIAQTTTTQTQQIDINAILQSLGGLGALSGLGGLTGTTTGGTTTGGTTTGGTTTGGTTTGTSTTAPGIIGNQFTTTSGGALGARRPGLFIQQAIALQNGTVELAGTGPVVEPNFFRDTAQAISEEVLAVINDLINTVNTGLGVLSGIGTGTGGTPTIINPATTGTGTTTPIS